MKTVENTPYWRLSVLYGCYFAVLGGLIPYWSAYLYERGFSTVEIGELMAIFLGTKIIAPYFWGWISDYTGQRLVVVRITAAATLIAFLGFYFHGGFVHTALAIGAFSFFWNASLPQIEATTLSFLGEHSHRYAMVRLWGSIGFVIAATALGWVLERSGLLALPHYLLVLLLGFWLASLWAPDACRSAVHRQGQGSLLSLVRRRHVMALLCGAFLLQVSFGPYYTFFTLYLTDLGYGKTVIGLLWSWGVVAEIGLFLIMHRLLARSGAAWLLVISLGLTAVRWLLLGQFAQSLGMLVVLQVIHAFSYGGAHAAAMQLIHRWFVGPHQVRGQALYSSLSFGAGGAMGNLLGGLVWDDLGGSATYVLAAGVAAVAAGVIYLGIIRHGFGDGAGSSSRA